MAANEQTLEVISGLKADLSVAASRAEESAKELEVARSRNSTLETLLSESKAREQEHLDTEGLEGQLEELQALCSQQMEALESAREQREAKESAVDGEGEGMQQRLEAARDKEAAMQLELDRTTELLEVTLIEHNNVPLP
jgi:hypothetical protein